MSISTVTHYCEINILLFSLSEMSISLWSLILLKSTFKCFLSDINIFELACSRENINILVFLSEINTFELRVLMKSTSLRLRILVKSTSLSLHVLMKSTFRCVKMKSTWWVIFELMRSCEINIFVFTHSREINIFEFTCSPEINIALCLKGNRHLWAHVFSWNQHFTGFEVKSISVRSQVDVRWTFHCSLSGKKISLWLDADFLTCEDLKSGHQRKSSIFAYIISWKRSKNQPQEYRTMFMFFYIEDHMQKFRYFWEKNNFTQNRHLAWFYTHPFNCYDFC